MFTAAGKLWGYLWNGESPASDFDNSGDEEPNGENTNVASRKEVLGTITHIFSNHGLIDNEIYFSFDNVLGGVRPSVNAKVNVVAVQQYDGGGWHAEQVSVTEDWDDDDDDDSGCKDQELSYPTDIVGHVTYCSGRTGYVNDQIFYDLDKCNCDDFIPCKGDWVKVKVSTSEENKIDAIASTLQPLRLKQTEGVITGEMGDHGYIDGEVFYMAGALVSGYVPKKWDPIYYTAVESLQGRCSWRAITIEPSKKPDTVKLIQGPLQMAFTKELLADKEGVVILQNPHFGNVTMGTTQILTVWVKNNGCCPQVFKRCHVTASSSQLKLKDIKLMKEDSSTADTGTDVTGDVTIEVGMTLHVNIELQARTPGEEKQLFVFTFEKFKIGRYVMASIKDPMLDMLVATSLRPYVADSRQGYGRYKKTLEKGSTPWVVPGERKTRAKTRTVQYPNRLPKYEVPDELRETISNHEDLLLYAPVLGQELNYENYKEMFTHLLHLEEIQMDIDIREFDLHRVCMRRMGECLGLMVPGLAEGRPSVLLGDKVLLSDPGDPDGPVYEGFVHELTKDIVLLKFNPAFHNSYTGKDYDVMFTFNRGPLRKCHKATSLALNLGENVLFPSNLMSKPSRLRRGRNKQSPLVPASSKNTPGTSYDCRFQFFNKSLNERQKSAVIRIVEGQGRPLPYILFGPPGTGKTVTVVEAVLQVFVQFHYSRIIVCTPSNSAADLVAQRLQESGLMTTADLVRLNAFQRSEESIPDSIKPFCTVGDNVEISARYRVLVSTCVSVGILYTLGIKPGHFTHVFIDEAGQATEPESMISECLVSDTDGQIVLAGDPQQLGPVLRSKFSKMYGLETSHLERLIRTPLYARNEQMFADHGSYDPLLVTKLVYNYRSHPSILSLPSKLFYHNELEPKADPGIINTFLTWEELLNSSFPVIFHGVRGQDTREGDSPSWFNPAEVVLVVRYLQSILKSEQASVHHDEIGIITPYRKQVEKIRLLIDKLDMERIKVGSVEEFQGQERQVIIISTVRSNEELIGFDTKHVLGFVTNPKRFNVAVTRAQALLIIIGNPHVLVQDDYWKAMIEYCVENGAYTGCDLPPDKLTL